MHLTVLAVPGGPNAATLEQRLTATHEERPETVTAPIAEPAGLSPKRGRRGP